MKEENKPVTRIIGVELVVKPPDDLDKWVRESFTYKANPNFWDDPKKNFPKEYWEKYAELLQSHVDNFENRRIEYEAHFIERDFCPHCNEPLDIVRDNEDNSYRCVDCYGIINVR